MSIRKRRSDRSGRAPLPSPGRPPVAGRDEQEPFWRGIAAGLSSEDAALEAGVSQPVGTRWFRKAGGMPPAMFRSSAKPLSGRYLSLAEREEIALLRVQGHSMQEIGRRLGRSASTISRELRRNAATRSGGLEYRATTAQWHAERSARRPKPTKLALNSDLAHLCGGDDWPASSRRRAASRVPGPAVAWKGRRHGQRQGSAMGQGMEPGADCPALADRLSGRRDDAHQPRSHLSGAVRPRPRSAAPRTDGLLANRAGVANAEGARTQARQGLCLAGDHDQRASGRSGRPGGAGALGRRPHPRALAARRSARWSSARRASRCCCIFPGLQGHGDAPRAKNGPALAGHGAEAVRDAITRTIITLPEELRRSLTWDQGAEMAQHAVVSRSMRASRSTSAIRKARGSAAPTRTPTGCCASTSRKAPI